MKRMLLVCSLLTATFMSVNRANAQTIVNHATFVAEVARLDSIIGTGAVSTANAEFQTVNTMMIKILSFTKAAIQSATTTTEKDAFISTLNTQQVPKYREIWGLKTDLVTNRTSINTKLLEFDGLAIYP